MKKFGLLVLFCVIAGFIIPFIVFFFMNMKKDSPDIIKQPPEGSVKVYFHEENRIKTMNTEEYLCGVVAGEMPASFETEALKAQAVAARSYTYYKSANPAKDHPEATVCTDSTHCKAYKSEEDRKQMWGEENDKYSEKIRNAVYATKGEVITYDGEVAMAVFHSQTGGGKTENSADVWGGDVPYLISVESHGEESAPNFYSEASFSFEDFKNSLLSVEPDAVINSSADIGVPEISEGGSVKKITIGGKDFSGKDIRSLFKLRSSCFKVTADDNYVTFEVTGYGHGVGMSQYGANTMAKEGYGYEDILKHYYTGVEITGV